MKKNSVVVLIFGTLFLAYLYLYAHEFEIRTRTEFWINSTKLSIALIMGTLLITLNTKWWIKLLSLLGFIGFLIFGLPQTGLWKHSLKKYVSKEKSAYTNFANEIGKINKENLSYISCDKNQLTSRPKLSMEEIENASNLICRYMEELDCVGVSLNEKKTKYLFVMNSFIGNGYGLLYCKEDVSIEEILEERINGLEIIGVVKVEEKWYYVSFT